MFEKCLIFQNNKKLAVRSIIRVSFKKMQFMKVFRAFVYKKKTINKVYENPVSVPKF